MNYPLNALSYLPDDLRNNRFYILFYYNNHFLYMYAHNNIDYFFRYLAYCLTVPSYMLLL